MNSRKARCILALCLAGAVVPSVFAQDNSSVTPQLNAVKPIVARIKRDATDMLSYTDAKGLSWQTHAAKLRQMTEDVNSLQDYMRGLQSHRTIASPWQQEAIDRITALANELATSMNGAIDHLSKSTARPTTPPYPEYLKANAQIANELGDQINETIDYGETRAKAAAAEKKLPQ
jgi:hypothetical protein